MADFLFGADFHDGLADDGKLVVQFLHRAGAVGVDIGNLVIERRALIGVKTEFKGTLFSISDTGEQLRQKMK